MTPEQTAVAMLPLLMVAILVEHLVLKWRGRAGYSQRRLINNLGVMMGSRAVLSAFGLAPLLGYEWLRSHLGLFTWSPTAPSTWVAAFILTDLAIWARHVAGHRVAILWAIHGVHHQSREYNMGVALRLSWFQDAFLIGTPLAALGLPLSHVLPCWVIGNLWQFILHTELVPKLGIVDRIIMTPSNHRVHHGCNPKYLDKNYGNIFPIWDQLFGKYVREEEPVEYGVLSGLKTYDASENSFEPFRHLLRKARAQKNWWDAVRTIFMPPGWEPGRGEIVPPLMAEPEPQRKNVLSTSQRAAATALALGALGLVSWLTWYADRLGWVARGAAMCGVILILAIAGVVLDNQPVEAVAAATPGARVRARVAAWILTLAGPDAEGPLKRLGRALQPAPHGERPAREAGRSEP